VITKGANDEVTGVAYGAELIAFADAVVARCRDVAMSRCRDVAETRDAAQKSVDDAGVVDAAVIIAIANFQRMVRIADGTEISIDGPLDVLSSDIRYKIGVNEFSSAEGRGKNGPIRRLVAPLMRGVFTHLMRSPVPIAPGVNRFTAWPPIKPHTGP